MLVRRWRGQGQGGWGWGRWARRVPVLSERLLGPGDAVCAWSTRWAAPLTSPLQCSVSGLCDVPLFILALRCEQGLVLPRLHALTGETVRAVWWLRAQALGWSCWGGGCGEGSKGHRLLCASVPTSVGGGVMTPASLAGSERYCACTQRLSGWFLRRGALSRCSPLSLPLRVFL